MLKHRSATIWTQLAKDLLGAVNACNKTNALYMQSNFFSFLIVSLASFVVICAA